MAGEDQERFEDYLELERYIEDLQAGRRAQPPKNLSSSQARIYRMAALFRAGSSDAEPSAEFAADLRARLLAQAEGTVDEAALSSSGITTPVESITSDDVKPQGEVLVPPQPEALPSTPTPPKRSSGRTRFFSRRSLLAEGAVAAASLAVGVSVGAAAQGVVQNHTSGPSANATPSYTPSGTPTMPLVPASVPSDLHFVTTLAELGTNAVRFVTDAVVGYVIRDDDGDGNEEDKVLAFSAACTHMGCIVQWQGAERHFVCPCHGGRFTEYGKPDTTAGRSRYLVALPRLETVVENGRVYVRLPNTKKP